MPQPVHRAHSSGLPRTWTALPPPPPSVEYAWPLEPDDTPLEVSRVHKIARGAMTGVLLAATFGGFVMPLAGTAALVTQQMVSDTPLHIPAGQMDVSVLLKAPNAQTPSSSSQIAAVQQFAQQHGLKIAQTDAKTHTVLLQGTPSQYEKAFGVTLHQKHDAQGKAYEACTGTAHLPNNLKGQVAAVTGLDQTPIGEPADLAGGPTSYSPQQLASMDGFVQGGNQGQGETIGIMELSGGFRTSDLQHYFASHGEAMPDIVTESVDGATNKPVGPNDPSTQEATMDVEIAGSIAPKAQIVVYFTPDSAQGMIDAQNQMDQAGVNEEDISWVVAEQDFGSSLSAMNQSLETAANQGDNVYAAAGDSGSSLGESGNNVSALAASPYAIGVGGTRILSTQPLTQTTWNDQDGATGGGYSQDYSTPAFQQSLNLPSRGVPDISADASPESGYALYIYGTNQTLGGTSAGAPFEAGETADIGSDLGPLPYLNTFYYTHTQDFARVTTGSNGAFSAGPGVWSPTTGLGVPNGSEIQTDLSDMLPAAQQPLAPANSTHHKTTTNNTQQNARPAEEQPGAQEDPDPDDDDDPDADP